jgi:NADH-quinone oxidoreductase subunit N
MNNLMIEVKTLMPYLILAIGILVTLVVSMVRVETKRPAQVLSLLTLIATFLAAQKQFLLGTTEQLLAGSIEVSPASLMILMLLSAIGFLFVLGSSRYLTKEAIHYSDYYHLLLIMILGGSLMAAAREFLAFFIALETLSLPAYALVGFRRHDPRSNEAAMKYFILGGAAGAVFMLGASFVFGATGSTYFQAIFQWTGSASQADPLFVMGHVLMLVALLFKVAAVPFHMWKPDVYEGAPVVVTGLMATVVSTAAFVGLYKVLHILNFQNLNAESYIIWLKQVLRVMAIASILIGSLIAIQQKNLKRLIAYSSINNAGFILLGILSSTSSSSGSYSIWAYLVGYSLTSLGLFILLGQSDAKSDQGLELIDLTGLMKRSPVQTILWSVFFFSMAGIPFTVGFLTKYSLLMQVVQSGETIAAVFAAVGVMISAYVYLRPIALMVMREPDVSASEWTGSWVSQGSAIILAVLVLLVGTIPQYLVKALQDISFNP